MKQIYLQSYFRSGYHRFMNYIYNISSHPKKQEIEKRLEIIKFFDEFGEDATNRAFGKKRSTIFLWKQKIKRSAGKLSALASGDRTPRTRTKRRVSSQVICFIESYRNLHPGVDKTTIKPILDAYCKTAGIASISESTIGRIIKGLKEKGKLPDYYIRTTINGKTGKLICRRIGRNKLKKLRSKGLVPKLPGELVQVDAISIFQDGIKRYIVCALDLVTRFAFAYSYKTLSSQSAKDFITKLEQVAPFAIKAVQTDNGAEFHKYFHQYLVERGIIHFWNYPKYPKGNAFVERFNGLIQRQYVGWHMEELKDTELFNRGLSQYLIWYNTEKVHRSIGKVPPLLYYVNKFMSPRKSNMLWTATNHSKKSHFRV
jgi:transposase InsO family protein